MNKRFILIKLKDGQHIIYELDKVVEISTLERISWYKQEDESGK